MNGSGDAGWSFLAVNYWCDVLYSRVGVFKPQMLHNYIKALITRQLRKSADSGRVVELPETA